MLLFTVMRKGGAGTLLVPPKDPLIVNEDCPLHVSVNPYMGSEWVTVDESLQEPVLLTLPAEKRIEYALQEVVLDTPAPGSLNESVCAGAVIVPLAGICPMTSAGVGSSGLVEPSLHDSDPVPVVTVRLPCESTVPVHGIVKVHVTEGLGAGQ
jgi:hypothetical protein